MSFEQPTLWLGLSGFPAALRQHVLDWLPPPGDAWPHWQLAPFEQADAWWVHGGSVRRAQDGHLQVHGPDEPPRVIGVIDRPVAFTAPLALDDFEARHLFNPMNDSAARGVLQQFEAWLRPLRAQFALGAVMAAREGRLRNGVFHLCHKGRLVAVIDLEAGWRVGLSPTARPLDLQEAQWERRPALARDIPPRFVTLPIPQLMWGYARRTQRDVLPARFRDGPIYLRRLPLVPQAWLLPLHGRMVEALSAAPGTLLTLAQRCDVPVDEAARAVAGLYYAGAITSSMKKALPQDRSPVRMLRDAAARVASTSRRVAMDSGFAASGFASVL